MTRLGYSQHIRARLDFEYIKVQTYTPYVILYVILSRLSMPYKIIQVQQFRHLKICLWSLDFQYGVNNQVNKVVILIRRELME